MSILIRSDIFSGFAQRMKCVPYVYLFALYARCFTLLYQFEIVASVFVGYALYAYRRDTISVLRNAYNAFPTYIRLRCKRFVSLRCNKIMRGCIRFRRVRIECVPLRRGWGFAERMKCVPYVYLFMSYARYFTPMYTILGWLHPFS